MKGLGVSPIQCFQCLPVYRIFQINKSESPHGAKWELHFVDMINQSPIC